jgi:hypothetical protein
MRRRVRSWRKETSERWTGRRVLTRRGRQGCIAAVEPFDLFAGKGNAGDHVVLAGAFLTWEICPQLTCARSTDRLMADGKSSKVPTSQPAVLSLFLPTSIIVGISNNDPCD